jgi:3-oxoacyl-[acyl-carrier-protein] synthase III
MPPVEIGPIARLSLLGGGVAFPRRELDNQAVLQLIPDGRSRSDERNRFAAAALSETLGVERRAWAHVPGEPLDPAHEESTLDLAITAAERALAEARLPPSELSLVLCATSTPTRMTTTLSAQLGRALGARAASFDVRTGCAGGIFALATAALYHQAGAGPMLVVGAETFSKIIPRASKLAMLTLADGAAALVLGAGSGSLLSAFLMSDGGLGHLVGTDGALPPTADEIARGGYLLSGEPDELAQAVPGRYHEALLGALERARLSPGEIDLFVPHQTGRALMDAVRGRVGIAESRTYVNLSRHGNVGAAGWMAALIEARAEGRARPGEKVAVASVGGGLSWAAAVLEC